jgi:putative exosortase-associated protein (TIGR04073 family)
MRIVVSLLTLSTVLVLVGCAGPERKFGRGVNNITEFARGGEMRRSMEQTALWDGPESALTTGFVRGLNRSIVRTVIGAYEVATFPLPPYSPQFQLSLGRHGPARRPGLSRELSSDPDGRLPICD